VPVRGTRYSGPPFGAAFFLVIGSDLAKQVISLFVDASTTDVKTGAAVGGALNNPDNLGIDHDGNIHIVEDDRIVGHRGRQCAPCVF
jgi:secreted PhoX family phosphatase